MNHIKQVYGSGFGVRTWLEVAMNHIMSVQVNQTVQYLQGKAPDNVLRHGAKCLYYVGHATARDVLHPYHSESLRYHLKVEGLRSRI
jgi:hypothetical protein